MDHRVNRQRYEAQLAEAQALSGHASEESSWRRSNARATRVKMRAP